MSVFLDDKYKGVPLEQVVSSVFKGFSAEDVLSAGFTWRGELYSTQYEISFFKAGSFNDGAGQWCYYLLLEPGQFGDAFDQVWLDGKINEMPSGRKYVSHDYYSSSLNDLDWHGGITYYQKHQDPDMPEVRHVKVGCDYGHIWDTGKHGLYNRDYVEMEARKTVKDLHERFPGLLLKCGWDGSWHPKSEMIHFVNKEDNSRVACYWQENAEHCSLKYWDAVEDTKLLAE